MINQLVLSGKTRKFGNRERLLVLVDGKELWLSLRHFHLMASLATAKANGSPWVEIDSGDNTELQNAWRLRKEIRWQIGRPVIDNDRRGHWRILARRVHITKQARQEVPGIGG